MTDEPFLPLTDSVKLHQRLLQKFRVALGCVDVIDCLLKVLEVYLTGAWLAHRAWNVGTLAGRCVSQVVAPKRIASSKPGLPVGRVELSFI